MFSALSAYAQEREYDRFEDYDENIEQENRRVRYNPYEFSPPPIRFHSFLITPKLETSLEYTDNLWATNSSKQSDKIAKIAPKIEIEKNLGRHSFLARLGSLFTKHADHSDEDTVSYNGEFSGVLEALSTFKIPFFVAHERSFEDRKDQKLDVNGITKAPIQLNHNSFKTGFVYSPNRLSLKTLLEYDQYRYTNNSLFSGIKEILEDRDYDRKGIMSEIAYHTGTDWQPFLNVRVAKEDYLNKVYTGTGFNGADRSNTAYMAFIGSYFQYKGLIEGRFSGGWTNREYDQANIGSTSDLALSANVLWRPSEKSQWNLQFLKQSKEDNTLKAAVEEYDAKIRYDHEILNNFFAYGSFQYLHQNYKDFNRVDKTLGYALGTHYIIAPNLNLDLEYQYNDRDSDNASAVYNENRFMINLKSAL